MPCSLQISHPSFNIIQTFSKGSGSNLVVGLDWEVLLRVMLVTVKFDIVVQNIFALQKHIDGKSEKAKD